MLFTHGAQGSQWMHRFDEFVPIPRLSEHGHFLLSAALVVITFAVVWRFFRNLLYLWCLCAAGFIMIHQQLFTGLQMENWHWAYLFCPCMILLLVLLTIEGIGRIGARARIAGQILAIAVVLNALAGVYLRGLEVVRTKDTQHYSRAYQDYARQHDAPESQPLVAGAATAGAVDFVDFSVIFDHVTPLTGYLVLESPSVSDLDSDRRIAFNAYLSGTSREQFEEQENWDLDHLQYGDELRDLVKRAARLVSRMALFDQVSSNPTAAMKQYQVRYLGLPANSPRPATLKSDWAILQTGPTWEVWEHNPASPAAQ
jgi:hypothetical protein